MLMLAKSQSQTECRLREQTPQWQCWCWLNQSQAECRLREQTQRPSINPPMYTLRSQWLWLVRTAPDKEGGRTQEWAQTLRLRNDAWGGGGQQLVRLRRSWVVRLRALDRATDNDYCHLGANQAQTLWPLWHSVKWSEQYYQGCSLARLKRGCMMMPATSPALWMHSITKLWAGPEPGQG